MLHDTASPRPSEELLISTDLGPELKTSLLQVMSDRHAILSSTLIGG